MVNYELLPGTREHAEYIAQHIRRDDALEGLYMLGKAPSKAVLDAYGSTAEPYTTTVEGKPAAMTGVVPTSILDRSGSIWMLSTDGLEKIRFGKRELRTMREHLEYMCRGYDMVENWVYDGNTTSLKLLRFLGFDIEGPRPMGLYQKPFRRFEMRFDHV